MPKATSTSSLRSTGLLVALAFALIVVGVLIYVAVGYRPAAKQVEIAPDVVDLGGPPPTNVADGTQISQAAGAQLQFVDKRDPNRLAAELFTEKLDPMGGGYYTLTSPKAWIYFKDGRAMHIRANNARVKMPSQQQQPEEGDFYGDVVLSLFAPRDPANSNEPLNPEKDLPEVLGVTDSLHFDTVLLKLSTDDPITISTKAMQYDGTGLDVRVNQVRERVELLQTTGKVVRFNPKVKPAKKAKPTTAKSQPPAPPAPPAPPQIADAKPATTDATSVDQPLVPPPATAAAPVVPAKPTEQLYRAVISDKVQVTQTTRTLKADTLEIFARLVDGQLPEDAFGVVTFEELETESGMVGTPAGAGGSGATLAAGESTSGAGAATLINPPTGADQTPAVETNVAASTGTVVSATRLLPRRTLFMSSGDKDVVLTWDGSLVLRPILDPDPVTSPPAELADGNHFAARFSAVKPGGEASVTIVDSASKASGVCTAIEYAATTRTLAMVSGGAAAGLDAITLDMPESGRLVAPGIRFHLGSGVGHVRGAGQLAVLKTPAAFVGPLPENDPGTPISAQVVRQITWTDHADFEFLKDDGPDGAIRDAIKSARFWGEVFARDAASSLSADDLLANFVVHGRQKSALSSVKAEGNVVAVAGSRTPDADRALPALDPYLMAQRLDVTFEKFGDETQPTQAQASGGVRAMTPDAELSARTVIAHIKRNAENQTEVSEITASGNARFERRDSTGASGEIIRTNIEHRWAELSGNPAKLHKDGATVSGANVRLDDASGMLKVMGPGAFDHVTEGSNGARRVNVTWEQGMQFVDKAGRIDCHGQAVVTSTSPTSTQTVKADKVMVNITPGTSAASTASGAAAIAPATSASSSSGSSTTTTAHNDERRLLRAEAVGLKDLVPAGPNDKTHLARVEVRNYSQPSADGARALEQIMYIEGPQIIADEVAGTLSVPSEGQAVVRDQRASGSTTGNSLASGTPRGTSQFKWAESMLFTRQSGELKMIKDVKVTHLPPGQSKAIRLEALEVSAFFTPQTGGTSQSSGMQSADLLKAVATGAVYAESGAQKMLGDRFVYDATTGMAEATAGELSSGVTLYTEHQQPVTAKRLLWNLKTDRVEVSQPSPTSGVR